MLKRIKSKIALPLALLFVLSIGVAVKANNQGTISTTDSNGSSIKQNIFGHKEEVYITGGPANTRAAGLADGDYYVKVTDASGKTTLGSSMKGPKEVQKPIKVVKGKFEKNYKLSEVVYTESGTPGFYVSDNAVYKVWVSKSSDFKPSESKTDNFKIGSNSFKNISLEAIQDVDSRILEGLGSEVQKLALKVSPEDALITATSSDKSKLQVSIEDKTLILTPLAKGKVTVTVNAFKAGFNGITKTFTVDVDNYVDSGKYQWQNVKLGGGGYVTGIIFHPTTPDILYLRTDIGGAYRYDFSRDYWIALNDDATDIDRGPTFCLSLALDKNNPNRVYAMTGSGTNNSAILISEDYGTNWETISLGAASGNTGGVNIHVHGNGGADRSSGERLQVDPNDPNILYMGTQQHGLWKSTNAGRTWTRISKDSGLLQDRISLVIIDETTGSYNENKASQRIIVGTTGLAMPGTNVKYPSLYISEDGGETWAPLEGQPEGPRTYFDGSQLRDVPFPGFVAMHAAFDSGYLYVAYTAFQDNNINNYSTNSTATDGRLYKFDLNNRTSEDVTPPRIQGSLEDGSDRVLGYGLSGVTADKQRPGTLLVSTIHNWSPSDNIFRTTDGGKTWKRVFSEGQYGITDNRNIGYAQAKNGGGTTVHWTSDVQINPFNSDMALFNTGFGVFMTKNLTVTDKDEQAVWGFWNDGLEMSVLLNVYSPPHGDAHILCTIADWGGFRWDDKLDESPANSFTNSENNERWINTSNLDYAEQNPMILVSTPRGNYQGTASSGANYSLDQSLTWSMMPNPPIAPGGGANAAAGWISISADAKTVVWSVGNMAADRIYWTEDFGNTWTNSRILNENGIDITGNIALRTFADRVNPEVFYGFGNNSMVYKSTDRGRTFTRIPPSVTGINPTNINLGQLHHSQNIEIRVEPGKEGSIWMSLGASGLWHSSNGGETFTKINNGNLKRVGFGMPLPGAEHPVIYVTGRLDNTATGVYGFYASSDYGQTWRRINDDKHQYGDIRSITGDPRIYGRVYVGTGSRGLVYGDIIWEREK
jgi:photosystem II stability/assembly factor-like uncharacterized protein